MRYELAVDLGTASTLVYAPGRGVVFDQPSLVALDRRTRDVLAIGADAAAMAGRAPGHIVAERPLRGGAIRDFHTAAELLRRVLRRVGVGRFARPRLLVCVPMAVTQVERRALEEAALRAGASRAHLLDEPMAAAIGAGLPVHDPVGSMVIDVGGGTSQVAVISLGGVVAARSVRTGGFDLDVAVQDHLRRRHGVSVALRTAEALKKAVGSAYPGVREPVAEVRGRELASGLPRGVEVAAPEVREALEEQLAEIVRATVEVFRDCPPELARDVLQRGITLVGGGALLRGLDTRIVAETGVAVDVPDRPREAVVVGAGRTLEAFDELAHLCAS